MSTVFLRPGYLHTADRLSSCTEESGLTVAPAVPAAANVGALRLRTSGVPLAVTSAIVRLMTGGNPTGYGTGDYGLGAGATAVWRNSTDSTAQYKGYIDSIYLHRVEFPVSSPGADARCSTPRTLADGALGFAYLYGVGGAGATKFTRITTAGAISTVTVLANGGPGAFRPDFIVLEGGRLVLFMPGTSSSTIESWYSDDHGATWTQQSAAVCVTSGRDCLCVEVVDDVITLILSDAAPSSTLVYVSLDGGCSASLVDNGGVSLSSVRTCVTPAGQILIATTSGTSGAVYKCAPGGGIYSIGVVTNTGTCYGSEHPIVCRDDGSIWAFTLETTAARRHDMRVAVSLDNGATWTDASGSQAILDCSDTPAVKPYLATSAGVWQGRIVMLATSQADTGTDYNIHLLSFGGWADIAEKRLVVASTGQPYEHTYVPTDYPDSFSWTRGNFGAGATVTNATGPLRISNTNPDGTIYTAPAAIWNPAAGDHRRIRFRCRVTTLGSVSGDNCYIKASMSDGANTTAIKIRFSTTQARILDASNNTLATVSLDQTTWTDWLIVLQHDAVVTKLRSAVYYKVDGSDLWTQALAQNDVAEIAGATNTLIVGGDGGGTNLWEVAWIGVADDAGNLMAPVNPTDLPGRALSASSDFFLANGIHLGGYHGNGKPADTYTVASTYQFAKENIWRELRPSRQVRSSSDNAAWNVVFDATTGNSFHGDLVCLFGTNFRTCTFKLNSADSWLPAAVSVNLDATVDSFTIATVGLGRVGVATGAKKWRPSQWRSDKDAHRWFMDIGGTVYEIADNDDDSIYVEDVDLSAASGTAYIFGDRMAMSVPLSHYRYARVNITAQQTADDHYRLGTVIFDRQFEPAQTYDHGFVDRIETNVQVFESEAGYRSSARIGPRRAALSIQWPPLNRLGKPGDLELRLRDLFAANDGGNGLVVVYRTPNDQTTLGLFRIEGSFQATNVWGEMEAAVSRVDTLTLVEEI